jgi:hypothetical protein
MYALPKNGLEDALSAQICSLSENCALLCRLAITGALHAPFVEFGTVSV